MLANCRQISEDLFNQTYDRLEAKVSAESESMYQAALRKAKTQKQKKECAGQYRGSWGKLFKLWCSGEVATCYVLEALDTDIVQESLIIDYK